MNGSFLFVSLTQTVPLSFLASLIWPCVACLICTTSVCVMCRRKSVVCGGGSLCYVRDLVCVLCRGFSICYMQSLVCPVLLSVCYVRDSHTAYRIIAYRIERSHIALTHKSIRGRGSCSCLTPVWMVPSNWSLPQIYIYIYVCIYEPCDENPVANDRRIVGSLKSDVHKPH